jgi:GntR family transcriptional regulator
MKGMLGSPARSRTAKTTAVFARIAPDAAGMPLYRAVARALLGAIESGTFAPGDSLPSETELGAAFEVSIGTVRKAVDELAAEHVVVRRQGRGTFVATHDTGRLMFQFFHVERSDGLRELPKVDLVSFQRGRADDAAAQALHLRAGEPVIEIENALRLQGSPVIHDRLVLPAGLFRGLSERRLRERAGTIYRFYQLEFGISVLRALERARAIGADRASARVLGVAVGAPAIEVRRTALTFNDRPVEYRVSVVNTARHDYVNVLSRQPSPSAACG